MRWVGEFLGLGKPTEDVVRLAATVEDSGGVYFVPAMVGLGAPHWDTEVRGALVGLGRDSKAGHMARAAIEAIAFQIRDVLEAMEMVAGHELSALRADGGATRNDELMQFQADVLGRDVVRSETEEELSALGAAWMAGLELGWWGSLEKFEELMREPEVFVPKIVTEERERRYAGWKDAVAKARYRPAAQEGVQMSDVTDIVLEARGVSKRYGANLALNNVTFRVHRGQVNVLIGENGAGKSTLMRLLAGAERATAGGEILMDGRVLELRSPREATARGEDMLLCTRNWR